MVFAATPVLAATVDEAPAAIERQAPLDMLIQLRPIEKADLNVSADASENLDRHTNTPRQAFAKRVGRQVGHLKAASSDQQQALTRYLKAQGISYRAFWVANVVHAQLSPAQIKAIAARPDVQSVRPNASLVLPGPRPAASVQKSTTGIEWGVSAVRAPEVWAQGFRGEGIVVAGQDTGVDWQHPALRASYRGVNGAAVSHDWNWHDAIVAGGANICGYAAQEPCDDSGHGSHTIGSMVGDDGASNQIGVAPGARWIACRNMNLGAGTVATYLDCFEWLLAPTDLAGNNPRPDLAPQIINNSWACPDFEGCTDATVLDEAIDNVIDAGILMVVAAGNAGPACSTIDETPAIHPRVLAVGAIASDLGIASFSSRGPSTGAAAALPKPDLVAPGAAVRSSIPGGRYASYSGTSMAAPHTAAVAALVMQANPDLIGQPERVAQILRDTAVATAASQTCGAVPGSADPNAVYGYGRLDAAAAVAAALAERADFGDGFE